MLNFLSLQTFNSLFIHSNFPYTFNICSNWGGGMEAIIVVVTLVEGWGIVRKNGGISSHQNQTLIMVFYWVLKAIL